jgi:DNA polymerase-1
VGAKSAAALLQTFDSIEAIPACFDVWPEVAIRGAKQMAERIDAHRERALKTKQLATILRKVPGLKPGLAELSYRGADRQRTEELFERLGWNRIKDRIPKWRD